MSLFNSTLTLDGLRKNYARTVADSRQPFDLTTANVDERLDDARSNHFFIGGYDWDGSPVYIDSTDGSVIRCSSDTCTPLNTWISLEVFLRAELPRLAALFDGEGRELEEDAPTTPDEDE